MALAVDVGLIALLVYYFDSNYLWATAIGFTAGCFVTFVISKLYVFADHSQRKQQHTFALFWVVGVAGLILNQIIVFVGVEILNLALFVSKALSALSVFWFNFFLRGKFVFKDPHMLKSTINT